MSWWRRLWAALTASPARLLVREGHELRWDRARLPVSVYVDASAGAWWEAIVDAVHELNRAAGRRVLDWPLWPIAEMTAAFNGGPVSGVRGAIYVTVGQAHCCEPRFDQRTGEILHALVQLTPDTPSCARAVAVHELAHALGLDHEPGLGVMGRAIRANEDPRLSSEAEALLRRTYG